MREDRMDMFLPEIEGGYVDEVTQKTILRLRDGGKLGT